jgi:hypothetical protein
VVTHQQSKLGEDTLQQITESQVIVNRLLNDEYEGDNKEILKIMDLNELSKNLDQLNDMIIEFQTTVGHLQKITK